MNKGEIHPFQLTIFKNQWDVATHRRMSFDSCQSFESFFQSCFIRQSFSSKRDASLFSPAVYESGKTRSNENVSYYGRWFAADIDSFVPQNPITSQEEIREVLEKSDILSPFVDKYQFFCYSTASSSFEKPKFRIVFPLSEIVYASNLRSLWFAMNIELNKMIDRQTKDMSRMFYTPGQYKDAFNFFWINDRTETILNPNEIIDKHTSLNEEFLLNVAGSNNGKKNFLDRLSPKISDEIKKYRKSLLENNKIEYHWKDYRDCPFVSKDALDEYRGIVYNRATGRYLGLYQLMVSIGSIALLKKYPISASELEAIIREIDDSIDGYYRKRKISVEVDRALEFVYSNNVG